MPNARGRARAAEECDSAEKSLWQKLRGRKLHDLKFLRQHPIGPFVVDFCCRDRRLIVELDGEVHEKDQQRAYDEQRDAYLRNLDYLVLRLPNEQVLSDIDSVLKQISNAANIAPPHWLRSRVHRKG